MLSQQCGLMHFVIQSSVAESKLFIYLCGCGSATLVNNQVNQQVHSAEWNHICISINAVCAKCDGVLQISSIVLSGFLKSVPFHINPDSMLPC